MPRGDNERGGAEVEAAEALSQDELAALSQDLTKDEFAALSPDGLKRRAAGLLATYRALVGEAKLIHRAMAAFAGSEDAAEVDEHASEACNDGVVELRAPGAHGRYALLACYTVGADGELARMPDAEAKQRERDCEAAMRAHDGQRRVIETAPTGWRRTEQLVALYLAELNDSNCPGVDLDLVRETFDWVSDWVLEPPRATGIEPDADYTSAEMCEIERKAGIMAEAMVRALIATGDAEEVDRFVEETALRRARCDAKFKMPRKTPFTDDEHKKLAAECGGG